MNKTSLVGLACGLALLVALAASCRQGGGAAVFGTDDLGGGAAADLQAGEPTEGVTIAADMDAIRIDPCDPRTPSDPDTGKLLGKTAVAAIVRDADLNPVQGAEVTFGTSAGELESAGQADYPRERRHPRPPGRQRSCASYTGLMSSSAKPHCCASNASHPTPSYGASASS